MKEIVIDAKKTAGDLDIGRFSMGQGGISSEPMIDAHTYELKNLNLKIIRLFIQEYFHVYPKKGVYNWKLLDKAVEAILATGAKPLMCIVIKPKVLFPKIDHDIVYPDDFKEWDKLIYEMVKHYNTDLKYGIEYWEVANEPNIGEWGGCPYHFTPENYPKFYEHTVKAVKKADPKAKVGGPALAGWKSPILPALVKFCAKKNVPLDFVSWHDYNSDPKVFRDSIIHVKKILKKYPKLKCETAIDEWNVTIFDDIEKHLAHPEYQPCFVVDVINHMIEQGLSHCCFYHIRSINGKPDTYDFLSKNGAICATNGQNYSFSLLGVFDYQGIVRPVYFAFKMLSRLLGKRLKVKKLPGNVRALAAYDEKQDMVNALIWNFKVNDPKPEKVNLKLLNLNNANGMYLRYMLDSKTDSNAEDDRMKMVKQEKLKNVKEVKDSFILPPYGVAQVTYKVRW